MVVVSLFRTVPDRIRATAVESFAAWGYQVFDWSDGTWLHACDSSNSSFDKTNVLERADMLWVHFEKGLLDPATAFALGIAHTQGIPVFAMTYPTDPEFSKAVILVDSPVAAIELFEANVQPRRPPLQSFQRYYGDAARARGYGKESARDAALLLMEEVGELARAIRKTEGLVRHGGYDHDSASATELADAFLYLIHLSNILDVDLGAAVEAKERTNIQRFLTATR